MAACAKGFTRVVKRGKKMRMKGKGRKERYRKDGGGSALYDPPESWLILKEKKAKGDGTFG